YGTAGIGPDAIAARVPACVPRGVGEYAFPDYLGQPLVPTGVSRHGDEPGRIHHLAAVPRLCGGREVGGEGGYRDPRRRLVAIEPKELVAVKIAVAEVVG